MPSNIAKKPSDKLSSKISQMANVLISIIEKFEAIDSYGKAQGYTEKELKELIMPYFEEELSKQGIPINELRSLLKSILTKRYKQRISTKINNEYRLRRMIQASAKADKEQ